MVDRWIQLIDQAVLDRMTLLPMDLEAARICGRLRAELLGRGEPIGENEVQIAALALRRGPSSAWRATSPPSPPVTATSCS